MTDSRIDEIAKFEVERSMHQKKIEWYEKELKSMTAKYSKLERKKASKKEEMSVTKE